jgi:hypothetical protein
MATPSVGMTPVAWVMTNLSDALYTKLCDVRCLTIIGREGRAGIAYARHNAIASR